MAAIREAQRMAATDPSNIQFITGQPDSPNNNIEGWKHMPTAIMPGIYDETLADRNMNTSAADAQQMVKFLARTEGLFVGVSSGAAVKTAVRVAQELEEGVVVTVLPDSGFKYLSEEFWDE